MSNPHIATRALHAGHQPDSETLSRAVPIYATTSYAFKDAEHAADLFALRDFGNIYSRLMNPTNGVLEQRMAALHSASGCVATASGMAAITYAVLNIAGAGDNIVSGTKLYGGTNTLFTYTLKRLGIEVRWVETSDPSSIASVIDAKTRLVYTESIGNPDGNVDDLDAIAAVAHQYDLPLIVDNTMTPPPIFDPFAHGADVVVYSLTKLVGGHGTAVGGCVIEKGNFNWANGKFPEITEPDPAYHGVSWWQAFGDHDQAAARGQAFTLRIRCGLLRDTGAAMSPFNAQQLLLGIETLPLRAEKHCANAQTVAEFLASHPKVDWVRFAGLSDHPDHARAKAYFHGGPSAVFGFGIAGGLAAGKRFIDRVKLCTHLANILDAKTLVIHPASTTHQQLNPAEQLKAGVNPEMIRISVGLEDVQDIIADLEQALAD
jgi:O-acetylhomoserine (thiol)-lyase